MPVIRREHTRSSIIAPPSFDRATTARRTTHHDRPKKRGVSSEADARFVGHAMLSLVVGAGILGSLLVAVGPATNTTTIVEAPADGVAPVVQRPSAQLSPPSTSPTTTTQAVPVPPPPTTDAVVSSTSPEDDESSPPAPASVPVAQPESSRSGETTSAPPGPAGSVGYTPLQGPAADPPPPPPASATSPVRESGHTAIEDPKMVARQEAAANDEAEARWLADHGRLSSRLTYVLALTGQVYVPFPPYASVGGNAFFGLALTPKYRHGRLLRTRALGYWGHAAAVFKPVDVVHRHLVALAGRNDRTAGVFYQFGMGAVHYVDRALDGLGIAVAAQAGYRKALTGHRALLIGAIATLDGTSDPAASLGFFIGLSNV